MSARQMVLHKRCSEGHKELHQDQDASRKRQSLRRNESYRLELDFRSFAIASIVGVSNAIVAHDEFSASILVAIQVGILLVLLIQRDFFSYICIYLTFLCMSLEFPAYYGVGAVYGFKTFRIGYFGISSLAFLPILLFALYVLHDGGWRKIKARFAKTRMFTCLIVALFILGFLNGLLNILIDDNGISCLGSVRELFFEECYAHAALVLFPCLGYLAIAARYSDRIEEFRSLLLAIMVGVVVTQLFSFITPFKGETWESPTLLVSFISFYTPLLICFGLFAQDRNRIVLILSGIVGYCLSVVYTLTSGGLLVAFLTPVFVLIVLIQQKKTYAAFAVAGALVAIVLVGYFGISVFMSRASILLEYKMSQAMSLLQFWNEGWYDVLPPSAKFRFQELGNIASEYANHPLRLIFGKGIMGTCLDYTGGFYSTSYSTTGGGFLDTEWDNGIFFSAHESLNVLFLTGGLFGLFVLGWVIVTGFANLQHSPFFTVGIVYFMFHYTYSFTASFFGLACFMMALFDIDVRQDEQISCQ